MNDWFERNKIKTIGLIMIFIWGSLLLFFWIKTDELTRDPCSICSEKQGKDVLCTTQSFVPSHRVYYPNGSIYQEQIGVIREDIAAIKKSNFSLNFSS